MEHREGSGSGWLPDYLDGLPGIKVDIKKAAELAEQAAVEEQKRLARSRA
jgi:hypothetical protein